MVSGLLWMSHHQKLNFIDAYHMVKFWISTSAFYYTVYRLFP